MTLSCYNPCILWQRIVASSLFANSEQAKYAVGNNQDGIQKGIKQDNARFNHGRWKRHEVLAAQQDQQAEAIIKHSR